MDKIDDILSDSLPERFVELTLPRIDSARLKAAMEQLCRKLEQNGGHLGETRSRQPCMTKKRCKKRHHKKKEKKAATSVYHENRTPFYLPLYKRQRDI